MDSRDRVELSLVGLLDPLSGASEEPSLSNGASGGLATVMTAQEYTAAGKAAAQSVG